MIDKRYVMTRMIEDKLAIIKSMGQHEMFVTTDIMQEILAMLKEQEPVEYVVHCKNADLSNGTEFVCGKCGDSLLHKKVNYCPWCGRKVEWNATN